MPSTEQTPRKPTVTRSKSPKRPAKGDPSPAREGQQPAPKAREGAEAAPGQGTPADPQVPRGREVISEDRTPETDTDRGPDPQEEGRTAR